MDSMNAHEVALVRHALGFNGHTKTSYRNHFVAGPTHPDYALWLGLVECGRAHRQPATRDGMDVFSVTFETALEVRREDEYLDSDFRRDGPAGVARPPRQPGSLLNGWGLATATAAQIVLLVMLALDLGPMPADARLTLLVAAIGITGALLAIATLPDGKR